MKTLLFLLLLAFGLMPLSVFAQHAKPGNPPPPGPAGLPPGELFVGTWQWSSGGEVFRMTLVRDPNWHFKTITRNAVTGQHQYSRNGVVVDQFVGGFGEAYSLLGMPVDNSSMRMGFHQFTPENRGIATLTLVPGNPDQLTWRLEYTEGIHMYTGARPAPYFVVPLTMTFTRQP